MDLSPEELSAWRINPTTVKFFRFLRDYRIQLAENVANGLAQGNPIDKEHADKVAMMCGLYYDLETIQISDIKNFYQSEKGESDNEQ